MQELFKQTALVEPPLLQSLFRRNQGNRASAALQIGIHRATLRQKLRKYGIERPWPSRSHAIHAVVESGSSVLKCEAWDFLLLS